MNHPILYLFIGYPGAGKTTIANIITQATGATHLWADVERHKLFPSPTHSEKESKELYNQLNSAAEYLLAEGKSVVFDTNFNFLSDREKLRELAKKHNASTYLIWVETSIEIAKQRAVHSQQTRNNYTTNMSEEQFDSIASKLEKPTNDETVIKIDGSNLDQQSLLDRLHISS
jgi:predicted kinase